MCSIAVFGLKYMFDKKMINQDDIDALIYVSNSHDYILPPTSNIIQGRLGLKSIIFYKENGDIIVDELKLLN